MTTDRLENLGAWGESESRYGIFPFSVKTRPLVCYKGLDVKTREVLLQPFFDSVPDLRGEIASYGVAPLRKLTTIRLGLELDQFLEAERHRGELRRELGIDADAPLVGIVGRLVPIKAPELFVQAALKVREALPQAQIKAVYNGEVGDIEFGKH